MIESIHQIPVATGEDTPPMPNNTVYQLQNHVDGAVADPLSELLRAGARRLIAQAVEAELAVLLEETSNLSDRSGRRRVVRNGHLPEREVQTGIGPVKVRVPRVHDREPGEGGAIRFDSKIVPKYVRRTRSIEALIPWLYLRGVSTGDFTDALAALLGPNAPGLSPATISRLKAAWEDEFEAWKRRDLTGKEYVYAWADGIHCSVRMAPGEGKSPDNALCALVIMGAAEDGRKELIAIEDGYRESTQSWRELLLGLKHRGLTEAPKLAVADGALGFWHALHEVYGTARDQRCWVHKTRNVLNCLPKGQQPKAKELLHAISHAETRAKAEKAFEFFLKAYGPKYPKAAECLRKDHDELLAFYDFPAEHWKHLRTTNPIESTFATVRLRTAKSRGFFSRTTVLTMVFKLARCAEKSWRRLNGYTWLKDVAASIIFIDGEHPDRIAA
jgi:putative transposase